MQNRSLVLKALDKSKEGKAKHSKEDLKMALSMMSKG